MHVREIGRACFISLLEVERLKMSETFAFDQSVGKGHMTVNLPTYTYLFPFVYFTPNSNLCLVTIIK